MKAIQAIISVFFIYHFVAIILMPISGSFLGRQTYGFYSTYATLTGLQTNWALFAPDPPNTFYIEAKGYMPEDEDEPSLRTYFPPEKGEWSWSPEKPRWISFVLQGRNDLYKMETVFGPLFCRKHPQVKYFKMTPRMVAPTYLDHALMPKDQQAGESSFLRYKTVRYTCPESDEILTKKEGEL